MNKKLLLVVSIALLGVAGVSFGGYQYQQRIRAEKAHDQEELVNIKKESDDLKKKLEELEKPRLSPTPISSTKTPEITLPVVQRYIKTVVTPKASIEKCTTERERLEKAIDDVLSYEESQTELNNLITKYTSEPTKKGMEYWKDYNNLPIGDMRRDTIMMLIISAEQQVNAGKLKAQAEVNQRTKSAETERDNAKALLDSCLSK